MPHGKFRHRGIRWFSQPKPGGRSWRLQISFSSFLFYLPLVLFPGKTETNFVITCNCGNSIYQNFLVIGFGIIPGQWRWDAASSSVPSITSSENPAVNLDPDMEEYSSDQHPTSSKGSLRDELNPLRKAENELPLEEII